MVYINGKAAGAEYDTVISDRVRVEYEKYAVCMLRLQQQANLTFKEARAYLCGHHEVYETLVKEYGITMKAVYNLARRGTEKVKKAGLNDEDLFGEYRLTIMYDP
jgi:hypothetical protein